MMWQIIRYIRLQRLSVVYVGCNFASKVFAFLALFLAASVAYAAGVERITNYQYDGAGNIVDIAIQEQAAPPTVSALSRGFINRANSVQITATGENLLGVDVLTDVQGLTISNVSPSNNQVTFTLAASAQATLGNAPLRFVTGLGEAEQSLIVAPVPPVLISNPSPIVIEGDSLETAVTLIFAEPRSAQETYTVELLDTSIATTPTTSFTIDAGQRQTTLVLTGIADGVTRLNVELAEQFNAYSFSVTVAKNFLELLEEYPDIQQRSLFSSHVGVMVEDPQILSNSTFSQPVGVTVTDPNSLASIYSNSVGIVVTADANDFDRLVYSESVGIVVSVDASNFDSLVYSNPVGVAVAEVNEEQPYSDSVGITVGALLTSIQPDLVSLGTDIVLEITGTNLQAVQSVSVSPSPELTLGTLSLNPEGTILFVPVTIGAAAASGVYEITLTGVQGAVPTRLNTPLTITIE